MTGSGVAIDIAYLKSGFATAVMIVPMEATNGIAVIFKKYRLLITIKQ